MSTLYNQELENKYKNNYDQKSVIVIGGGPLGILSLRYLTEDSSINVICFEAKDNLGGMWYMDKYDSLDPTIDHSQNAFIREHGVVQSSLYENLDLNNPKMMALYKGHPCPKEFKEYMTAEENLQYITSFAEKYNVRNYTSFNTYVNIVRLVANMTEEELANVPFKPTKRFLVQVVSYHNYDKEIRHFQADYIYACSGHFSKPNIQKIPNQEVFEGEIVHTHHYRPKDEDKFANKNIVLIGSMISAQDIFSIFLFEVRNRPTKITVISRKNLDYLKNAVSLQETIQKGQIEFIQQDEYSCVKSRNSLELKSGRIIENVDIILLATGYLYFFPYLDKYNHIDNLIEYYEKSRSFGPLYNKLISINEPHLLFPGCLVGVSQSHHERQAFYAAQYVFGKFQLPSKEEMQKEFEEELEKFGGKRGYLAIAKFPSFIKDHDVYVRKLHKDLKGIEFDEYFQEQWVIYGTIIQNFIANGNYHAMKKDDLSHMDTYDYVPKLGLF
ncbi:hypothetical protein ABPG72_003936 [Tetrahymena utriculariae]